MVIIRYLLQGLSLTAEQLLLILGPIMLLALVMHYVSDLTRNTAARLVGIKPFVWFTAIGTAIHELGHAIFCVIFGHRITDICLFNPKGETLGYVSHSYNPRSIYQNVGNFFISTGPLWLGTALVYGLVRYLLQADVFSAIPALSIDPQTVSSLSGWSLIGKELWLSVWHIFRLFLQPSLLGDWKFYFFLFLLFNIGSHMKLSAPDLAGVWVGFVAIYVLLLLVNLMTQWKGDFLLRMSYLAAGNLSVIYALMLFVIGLNLAVLVLVSAIKLLLNAIGIG